MTDSSIVEQTVGLIPVALATGIVVKTFKELGTNRQGEPITRETSYDPVFKDTYLDLWFDLDKKSYEQAHKECDGVGNEMLRWNYLNNPATDEKLHQATLKEMNATTNPVEKAVRNQERSTPVKHTKYWAE